MKLDDAPQGFDIFNRKEEGCVKIVMTVGLRCAPSAQPDILLLAFFLVLPRECSLA